MKQGLLSFVKHVLRLLLVLMWQQHKKSGIDRVLYQALRGQDDWGLMWWASCFEGCNRGALLFRLPGRCAFRWDILKRTYGTLNSNSMCDFAPASPDFWSSWCIRMNVGCRDDAAVKLCKMLGCEVKTEVFDSRSLTLFLIIAVTTS